MPAKKPAARVKTSKAGATKEYRAAKRKPCATCDGVGEILSYFPDTEEIRPRACPSCGKRK